MASILNTVLPSKAIEIRDETDAGENTATRVGELFEGIIDYIGSQEPDWLRDTVGTGQGQITGLGELVGSLNDLNNPGNLNQILAWKNSGSTNPNGWGYITTPTGGSGTGNGDVTWSQLTTTAEQGHQIDGSHLANALSNYLTNAKLTNTGANASKYTWWGRYLTPSTSGGVTDYKVEGPLSGDITYIQFSNGVKIEAIDGTETTSPALRVVDANTTAGTADFYAMGGVSALGNSSSGGGGDTPVAPIELGAILNHVKDNTASVNPVPNIIPEGATIRWDGDDWVVDKTTWGDLGAAPSLTNIGDTGYLKCEKVSGGYDYSWVPIGNVDIDKLSSVGDVKSYNPNSDGILYYVNNASSSEKWQYRKFAINSNDTTTNGYDLTSIILNDTKYTIPTYSLPLASSEAKGGIKIGFSESNSGSSSSRNYAVKLSSERAYVNVPWTDSDHTYAGGAGITVGTTPSNGNYPISVELADSNPGLSTDNGLHILLKNNNSGLSLTGGLAVQAAGGLTVDNEGVKIDSRTDKRVLWGNPDTLLNDIGKEGERRNLQYVGDILMKDEVYMSFDSSTANENEYAMLTLNSQGLHIGMGYNSESGGSSLSNFQITLEQLTYVRNSGNTPSTTGLRIGNAILYWEEDKQALALAKYNESQPDSPTAANFYATGGVSALGFSDGTSSIDAMTFGNLTVTDSIDVANKIIFDSNYEDDVYIKSTSSQLHLSSLDYIYLDTPVYNISIGNGSTISGIRVGTGNKLVFTIDGSEYNVSYTQ